MRLRKIGCLLICFGMLCSLAVGVNAQEAADVFEQMRAQFGPVQPVSAENSIVDTYLIFQNVAEPTTCTLRWYINDVLYKEEREFRLQNGAVSELRCSMHFGNDTPEASVLWVELTDHYSGQKAVFVQELRTQPIQAVEEPKSSTYLVHVIRNQCTVIVYEKDENGDPGRIVNVFLCSPGRNNWTITGQYATYEREEWLSLMGGVSGHYATLIWGDFLFHSVPYRGSWNHLLKAAEYNKLGTPASEGCIRMAVSDAKWIYENCVYGTEVHLFDSDELPVVKPVGIQIDPDGPNAGWDPTDPHPDNPTRARYIPTKSGVIRLPERRVVWMVRL